MFSKTWKELSIWKTLYFNFQYFEFRNGLNLTIFVAKNMILQRMESTMM